LVVNLISQGLFCQNSEKLTKENPIAVYLDSPLFYRDWYNNSFSRIITANLEYLLKTSKSNRISFSLGVGSEFSKEDYQNYDIVFFSEVSNLFGKRNHFFEVGLGPCYASGSLMIKTRLGYRMHLGNRFMFRLGYTPYIWLRPHYNYEEQSEFVSHSDLSVSLGYRFGYKVQMAETKTDSIFNSLIHSIQLNYNPYYQSYKGWNGNEKSLQIEITLKRSLHYNILLSAGISRTKQHFGALETSNYIFPLCLTMLYGNRGRYIETGIKLSGPIKWRYSSFYYLQPIVGYRQYFIKRIFAHLLYSPYFWLSNKEDRVYIAKDFVQNFTIGLGFKF